MGYFFVMCDLCMKLEWEFDVPNNTGKAQIICIYMLLITTFASAQLPSYCLQCGLLLLMPVPPEVQHLQLL